MGTAPCLRTSGAGAGGGPRFFPGREVAAGRGAFLLILVSAFVDFAFELGRTGLSCTVSKRVDGPLCHRCLYFAIIRLCVWFDLAFKGGWFTFILAFRVCNSFLEKRVNRMTSRQPASIAAPLT